MALSAPNFLARAEELLRLGRYDLALVEVGRALAAEPHAAEPHVTGAWILRAQGRLVDAEAAARAALAADPSAAAGHHVLACVLWSQGRLAAAEAAFRTTLACALDPDRALHLSNFARLLSALGRHAEALDLAEQALRLAPGMAGAHEVQGTALAGLGRADGAEMAYRAALRIDPRNFQALNKLGLLELGRGQAPAALDCFRDALRLRPGDAAARANMVAALKARHRLYGRVLTLLLRRGPLARRVLGPLLLLLFLLPSLTRLLGGAGTLLGGTLLTLWSTLLLALVGVWLLVLAWRWIVDPLFDTLLLLDPLGRQALEHDLSDAARLVALGLAGVSVLGYVLASLLLGPDRSAARLAASGIAAGLLALLASVPLRGRRGAARVLLWIGYAGMVPAAYGLAAGRALESDPLTGLAGAALGAGALIYLAGWALAGLTAPRRRAPRLYPPPAGALYARWTQRYGPDGAHRRRLAFVCAALLLLALVLVASLAGAATP